MDNENGFLPLLGFTTRKQTHDSRVGQVNTRTQTHTHDFEYLPPSDACLPAEVSVSGVRAKPSNNRAF